VAFLHFDLAGYYLLGSGLRGVCVVWWFGAVVYIKKLARWGRRRYGVASTRFVVRRHAPWGGWAIGCVLLVAVLMLGLFWKSTSGDGVAEVDVLRQELLRQREELLALQIRLGGGRSLDEMERSARSGLLEKVRNLERENAALKEDMLLFERLVPSSGEEAVVRIESFRVWQEGGGRYRYRWLVAYRPGGVAPEFHGRLQIVVSLVGEGGRTLMLSDKGGGDPVYRLDVKGVARREGGFVVPQGELVSSVELRVLQNEVIKAKRMAQL